MLDKKPLILEDGKIREINFPEETSKEAFLSGTTLVPEDKNLTIPENLQSITFIQLTIDGTLNLEGDLWLA